MTHTLVPHILKDISAGPAGGQLRGPAALEKIAFEITAVPHHEKDTPRVCRRTSPRLGGVRSSSFIRRQQVKIVRVRCRVSANIAR